MSPAATALLQEVMREMRRCREYGLSAPLTRWMGMLRKAGEGAQTVSIDDDIYWDKNRKTVAQPMSENFARLIEDAQQLPPPEWMKPRIAVDVTPLAASSARAGSETLDAMSGDELMADVEKFLKFVGVGCLDDAYKSVTGLRERVKFTEDYESLRLRLASVPAVAAPSVGAAGRAQEDTVSLSDAIDPNAAWNRRQHVIPIPPHTCSAGAMLREISLPESCAGCRADAKRAVSPERGTTPDVRGAALDAPEQP